ncbi:hypothetical protein [Nodosilinea sp. E11]|uniref:hypothetical protein n=1 Tax=Nodosilinea sp. E11 TaxID=3037479 RepID=UPI0029349036|nr:hypothetical protein [Nodosilinea sp. E11]WOD40351.1 hypothetical protein RRF56_06035 [Nodosilinea sp. E11]
MIAVAVSLNLVIALFCFYLAWRLWRLTQTLAAVADALGQWEQKTHKILNPAATPSLILRGQTGTARLRHSYDRLQVQVQRLNQVMAVIQVLPLVGRWVGLSRRQLSIRPRVKVARAK